SASGTGVYGKSTTGLAGQFDGTTFLNGNVGIGTGSPAQRLSVTGGNIEIDGGRMLAAPASDVFAYDGKSPGNQSLGWVADSWNGAALTGWLSGNAGLKFFTGQTARLAITQAGNVGIGT